MPTKGPNYTYDRVPSFERAIDDLRGYEGKVDRIHPILFRRLIQTMAFDGVSIEKASEDIAPILGISRDEVQKRLEACPQPRGGRFSENSQSLQEEQPAVALWPTDSQGGC